MPTVQSHKPGAPCWIDLVTSDLESARSFYTELFAWSYDSYPLPNDMVYLMSTIRGSNVAGLMQQEGGSAAPPTWQAYFAVDDADAAAERVTDAGGRLLYPVDEIPGSGRTTMALDVLGARFALWQSTGRIGSAVVGEHGAPLWHELQADDAESAAGFYETVLGLGARKTEITDIEYTELTADGTPVAGIMSKESADQPNTWLVYFGADDPDQTVELAVSLGGSVVSPPFDIPGVGRMAVLSDPQGAVFAVMRGEG